MVVKMYDLIQRLTAAYYQAVGCDLNDIDCMRAISDAEVRTFANQASVSMAGDNIAMVLNNAFSPVSRSDLFPETLFDAFKNVSLIRFETWTRLSSIIYK